MKKLLYAIFMLMLCITVYTKDTSLNLPVMKEKESINLPDLQERDDVYYYNGKPFTGEVTKFIKTEEKVLGNLVEGLKQGMWKSYSGSGDLASEANWVNGKMIGVWKTYYEEGKLMEEGSYLEGKQDGLYKSYYENGQIKEIYNYVKGRKDGEYEFYNKNGELFEKGKYIEGRKVKSKEGDTEIKSGIEMKTEEKSKPTKTY